MIVAILLLLVGITLIVIASICDEWEMGAMGIILFFLSLLLLFVVTGHKEEPQTEVVPQPEPIPMMTITEQEYILLQSFVPDSLKQGGN